MAIPPEPIEEILPGANAAVLAEVVKVLEQGPNKQPPDIDERASDVHSVAGRQVVELKVTGVLFGGHAQGATLKAVKPAGAYALRAGNKGPFLLTGSGDAVEIVGRYGPDTYSEERIRDAAKKAGKT